MNKRMIFASLHASPNQCVLDPLVYCKHHPTRTRGLTRGGDKSPRIAQPCETAVGLPALG